VDRFAVEHAFLWESGKMTDLGSLGGIKSWAVAINEEDQIVGESLTRRLNPDRHAFLWQTGKMTDLSTLGGRDSDAVSINNSGQIVGYSQTGEPEGVWHALLWENGTMHDLGAPGGKGTWSTARAINNRGQVIIEGNTSVDAESHPQGRRAFVWQSETTIDLPTLGGKESHPSAINDRGQIVGTSTTRDDVTHAVLWTLRSG
jgi:probable HAF family extracellular repeat protein